MTAYAGIGSRQTPDPILAQMRTVGALLGQRGLTLRSGAAPGADTAFEQGAVSVGGPREIFLPWPGFQGRVSVFKPIPPAAYALAAQFHPTWANLNATIRALMARNAQQILGAGLNDPVAFVVCWTPDGCFDGRYTTRTTGGTGQALRMATAWGIPIFNAGPGGNTNLDRLG